MISLAALAAATALQVPPPPAPPAPPAPPRIERDIRIIGGPGGAALDADGDGFITRDEFIAPMAEHFTSLDADGDGRISVEELRAGRGGSGGPGGPGRVMMFRHGGPDGAPELPEGVELGEGEEIAPGVRRFEWTSSDGGVRRVVMIRAEGGPDAPPPPPPHPAHPPHPPMPPLPPGGDAAQMDTDGDGRVSQAEFVAPLAEAFARANRRIHIVRREETR